APVTAPPRIRRRSAILIRPGEAIPFGRPYRTHLNRPHSSPVHSSGLDAPDQAHSGSLTRDVSPRLGYPSRRAPRRSEAFRRWCAAPLSTLYPVESKIRTQLGLSLEKSAIDGWNVT
ncbi:hypothetical protein Tco_0096420, partial [Tanacetum coccineum]